MTRGHRSWVPLLLVLASVMSGPVRGQDGAADGYRRLLDAAVDLDQLWSVPAGGARTRSWTALETEVLAGARGERVMVRASGDGVLVRLWVAEPRGVLRFYLGGGDAPVWEIAVRDLLRGAEGVPGWPLVAETGGGGVAMRLPVPFRNGLVVTTDASGEVEYQAQVRSLPADEADRIPDFDPGVLAAALAHAASVAARMAAPPRGNACTANVPVAELPADGGAVLAGAWRGPGVLRATRVRWIGAEGEVFRARRSTALRFVVDGLDRGSVPLDALRSHDAGGGFVLVRGGDGADVFRMPVPCRESLRLELHRIGEEGASARVEVVTEFEARPVADTALDVAFVVSRSTGLAPPAQHVALEASGGAGRFAGLLFCVDNHGDGYWGGGGENVHVDSEREVAWRGTGIDAYTGAAFAADRAFVGPFEGQPVVPGSGYRGRTQAFRIHALDAVGFDERVRVTCDVRPFGTSAFDLTTVAIAYLPRGVEAVGGGSGGPSTAAPPEPASPRESFTAQIEGEDLRVVEVRGGEHQVQRLNEFSGARWSRDAHLWWLDGKPGDAIVVAVPVPAAGRYRLLACWTTARDYGVARVRVAGEPVGGAFDLYTEQVRNTGLVEHGLTPPLEAGEALLEIELVGRNEKAVPRHMVGLDYLRLVPVGDGASSR